MWICYHFDKRSNEWDQTAEQTSDVLHVDVVFVGDVVYACVCVRIGLTREVDPSGHVAIRKCSKSMAQQFAAYST